MNRNMTKLTLRKFRIISCVIIGAISMMVSNTYALTPSEIFNKSRNKISSAKTLSADFILKANGQTTKGKLYSKGKKFSLISNLSSNWYNGKDLYTYNKSSNETYIFKPDLTELAEINPLLYLNSASDYKVTGKKEKKKGIESIILIPKKTGTGIKSINIDLNDKTFLPVKIIINTTSGIVELNISNIALNVNIQDSVFEYPKTKYPSVKVTDIR